VVEARRRWRFRRGRVHRRVHLNSANLRVQPKGAMAAAKAVGDGNGGPRPRLAGSGELDGGVTLLVGTVSIYGSWRT
jgi:hypothetical protein